MKKINEDHKEIASGKKKDDEGYMARNELDSIERQIKSLRKVIKSGDTQLPAWVQSKITKAADYIDTAAEYLQSDESIDENIKSNRIPGTKILTGRESQIAPRTGAKALGPEAASTLGPKAQQLRKTELSKVDLPKYNKEEVSLVEKILSEKVCGKGMYWCNTDKKCKPIPSGFKIGGQREEPTEVGIGAEVNEEKHCNHSKKGKTCPVHGNSDCSVKEEIDPKGPVQPYKSLEEIAKKHGVSMESIKKELEMGIKVEGEHTSDKKSARITALQHLDEVPNYYTKLKKVEKVKSESVTIEDMFGNDFVEFVDLIKPEPLKKINESVTLKSENGNIILSTVSWRGKYYTLRVFFPQAKIPSRQDIESEINKIYPGSRVISYRVSNSPSDDPLFRVTGGSFGKSGPSKNYVKPMGEEIEIEEKIDLKKQSSKRKSLGRGSSINPDAKPTGYESPKEFRNTEKKLAPYQEEVEISEGKKSEMKCNKPKAEAHGSGESGKSHVVKACEGGKEKLIRFGQLGVKGSPKKKGESKAYASRRRKFKMRHEKNIKKGKMSAAFWANKVKW